MNNDSEWREQWITVTQAASEIGVRPGKISGLIRDRALETQSNPIDKRQVLVSRKAVYELFRKKLARANKSTLPE